MFGLKRGDNPHCPACALARLRKEELKVHQYERSTRPNHRWHLDIAFAGDTMFQVYVDDYSRVSHVDILDSKGDVFDKWVELKKFADNKHAPYSTAFIRTDNEFAWLAHALTPERVKQMLPEAENLTVTRHVLPHLKAVNFVIEGILGQGVASQARFDPQAKGLGEWLRSRHIDIPETLAYKGDLV